LAFFRETAVPDQVAFLGGFRVLEDEGLRGLLDLIRREVRTRQAEILVLDGLATVGDSAASDLELKKLVHELQTQAVFTGCTMFLLRTGVGAPQTASALRIKASALRLPVADLFADEHVLIEWQPATEALVDEVCHRLLAEIRRRKVRRLFLDGADYLQRLSVDSARMEAVLAALCNELRALGVTTFVTVETELAGIVPGEPLAGLALKGLSPMAENIVVLPLAALRSEIHRLIAVVKARDSRIDMRFRRFEIAARGVVVEQDSTTAETVLRDLI
jgi:KaiC/GvpD/RAD55 family RecA-like ATPase